MGVDVGVVLFGLGEWFFNWVWLVWFLRFSLFMGFVWLLRKRGKGKKGEGYVCAMPTHSFPVPTMVAVPLFLFSFLFFSSFLWVSVFLFWENAVKWRNQMTVVLFRFTGSQGFQVGWFNFYVVVCFSGPFGSCENLGEGKKMKLVFWI